jgi:MFS superfamily sulfate permease-like transporter
LPVSTEYREDRSIVRFEGEILVTSIAEIRRLLLEELASGRDLLLDLKHAEEIDLSFMQLLWATGSEAERGGIKVGIRLSETVAATAREAGFERFPGLMDES